MTHSKAVVTLAVGHGCRRQWEELCRSNWTQYADKHGYDLLCLDKPLDSSAKAAARSPSWQKCLILSTDFAKSYEQIVWVDSDILINNNCAPCIASSVPVEKVGGVNLWAAPGAAEFRRALFRLNQIWRSQNVSREMQPYAADYYASWGLPEGFNEVITASVLVLSPHHHKDLLEHVYYNYDDRGDSSWNYEMRPLSYEIIKSGAVAMLDCRFSTSWSVQMALHYPFLLTLGSSAHSGIEYGEDWERLLRCCVNIAFHNSYFLHFGPRKAEMKFVDTCSSYDEEDFLNSQELAALKIILKQRDAALRERDFTISVRERDLARRQHELNSMKRSLSWSITAPLRKIDALMAHLRSRLSRKRS